ncbi:PaaI family thioesterase [Motiliproteus sediminis]|uniref:PaaI family thioesterase n=1 Tax=Motiliproteus sediminis TaxID=1468178 RepID=UPI001AEF8CE1|nr:PaaI family thioesterase [Motiliproteus sediminis]
MSPLTPQDSDFESRIRQSFSRQGAMTTLGAELTDVKPGRVVIELRHHEALTQHHGYLHAGMLTTIVDNACGYAASSLMAADSEVVTVEFKVNFIAPAKAPRYRAVGSIVRAGRTLTVCSGEVLALTAEGEQPVATMLATMMAVSP